MKYLNLSVSNSTFENKSKRVTHLHEDGTSNKIDIFYEFDRIIPWSDKTLLDAHLLSVLMYASKRGKNIKVYGTISHQLLRNIEEYLLAWHRWRPEIYKVIEIIPERIETVIKSPSQEKAIAAFSGGVDATFTALRHTRMLPESTRYPLRGVVMVHGFDVDIYNHNGFARLIKRVQPLLDDLKLDLRTIRTNSRELKLQDWEDSHALELAACLHMYSDEFNFGLIGSTDSYEALVLPWGSNAVTDRLMSGNNFSIIHDGAGFCRTDKVAEIAKHPLACKVLKVCWAGADQSDNCGKCEKCVRTHLNFLAVGMKDKPSCFPRELDLNLISKMELQSEGHFAEVVSIAEYAKAHNIIGKWVDLLNERIKIWHPMDADILERKKKGGCLKIVIVTILQCANLEKPAKKIWRRLRRAMVKLSIIPQ